MLDEVRIKINGIHRVAAMWYCERLRAFVSSYNGAFGRGQADARAPSRRRIVSSWRHRAVERNNYRRAARVFALC